MLVSFPYFEFELSAGEAVSLNRLAGWTIAPVCGRIWLTEENGREDIWLTSGQKYSIRRGGKLVIEAWQATGENSGHAAKIRLRPPPSAFGPRLRLPGLRPRCAVFG